MPVTESYQVDVFAIIVILATVLILVFLIIASIYFWNLIYLKPPSSGEASFLFWTSIILIIIFLIIGIYALIRIFTHRSLVYHERLPIISPLQTVTATNACPTVVSQLSPIPVTTQDIVITEPLPISTPPPIIRTSPVSLTIPSPVTTTLTSMPSPIRSDQIPIRSDQIPIRSDQIPIRSNQIPIRSDQIPIRSDQIPIRSDQIPIRSDQTAITIVGTRQSPQIGNNRSFQPMLNTGQVPVTSQISRSERLSRVNPVPIKMNPEPVANLYNNRTAGNMVPSPNNREKSVLNEELSSFENH